MINCHMHALASLCSQLMLEQIVRTDNFAGPPLDEAVDQNDKERIRGWLKIAKSVVNDFELTAADDRIKTIHSRFGKSAFSQRELGTELRVLRETIHDGLKDQFVYRYSQEMKTLLSRWQADWAPVLQSFPSVSNDVVTAVDLIALGHATASAFHSMRILEVGLSELAKDVGKTFDVQNWQNIIDQIESEIRVLGKTLSSGPQKSARLRFLSEAAKEFVYFKDGWRNHVAHNRAHYNVSQAQAILEHVRSFMTTLSSQLRESPRAH